MSGIRQDSPEYRVSNLYPTGRIHRRREFRLRSRKGEMDSIQLKSGLSDLEEVEKADTQFLFLRVG